MGHILRDWFLPEDGIRREVISADIQSFLGNDATVRPGTDVVDGRKVKGYWIRAYRNLTSNMIADLKHKSSKWDQESKRSGKRVNYEDSRTYREQGSRPDTGKHSPRVEVAYNAPPSRHAVHPDAMDYEPSRPITRPDPHSRTHLANTGAVVGSYGEPVPYAPSRSAPPGYIIQGNEYVPEPGYHSSRLVAPDRGSPQHIPGYGGHPSHHPRDVDMIDPRYPPSREDIRYASRDDGRYAHSREDVRYASSREDPRYHAAEDPRQDLRQDPRHRSTRDDPRYGSSTPHSVREDPRYASQRDPRDDPRYQSMSRDDPRLPSGYQDPPHPARYAYPSPPATSVSSGSFPCGPDGIAIPPERILQQSPKRPDVAVAAGQTMLTADSYAQPQVFDQYGRPVAYPPDVQPIPQAYQPQPTSRMETPYSNSSRKRGAPPEESSSRHSHGHGRMR